MLASVLVVDWRRPDLTRRCLRSLLPQAEAAGAEVVLVVNEARPQDLEAYRADFPAVVVRGETGNAGFAGGVARAVEAAAGEVLVLVNNDAVVEAGFLEAGLSALREGEGDVAAVAATVVLEGRFGHATGARCPDDLVGLDGRRWRRTEDEGAVLVNGTGVGVTSGVNGYDRDWLLPEAEVDGPGHRAGAEPFGFSGGAAFLRRSALEAVGGFDPGLFMYYEDLDVAWRLRLAGWRVVWSPAARTVHRHAASSSSDGPLVRYQSLRNRLAVAVRNGSWRTVGVVVARTAARCVLDTFRPAVAHLTRGQWWSLLRESLALVPRALQLRRADAVSRVRRREVERAFFRPVP